MARTTLPVVRHLTVAQGLSIAGSSVDLTLTGIVGARIAPTPALATLPFSVIFLAAGLSTFVVSRAIGRFGYRRVFIVIAIAAAVSGCVSAAAIQLGAFWLFCVGTSLIGVYQAGTGYYRYLAAESMPGERPRAVATVLAGGLVAAIVGPFAATALRDATPTPYVASYLLVAALGTTARLHRTVAAACPAARRRLGRARGRDHAVHDDRRADHGHDGRTYPGRGGLRHPVAHDRHVRPRVLRRPCYGQSRRTAHRSDGCDGHRGRRIPRAQPAPQADHGDEFGPRNWPDR